MELNEYAKTAEQFISSCRDILRKSIDELYPNRGFKVAGSNSFQVDLTSALTQLPHLSIDKGYRIVLASPFWTSTGRFRVVFIVPDSLCHFDFPSLLTVGNPANGFMELSEKGRDVTFFPFGEYADWRSGRSPFKAVIPNKDNCYIFKYLANDEHQFSHIAVEDSNEGYWEAFLLQKIECFLDDVSECQHDICYNVERFSSIKEVFDNIPESMKNGGTRLQPQISNLYDDEFRVRVPGIEFTFFTWTVWGGLYRHHYMMKHDLVPHCIERHCVVKYFKYRSFL